MDMHLSGCMGDFHNETLVCLACLLGIFFWTSLVVLASSKQVLENDNHACIPCRGDDGAPNGLWRLWSRPGQIGGMQPVKQTEPEVPVSVRRAWRKKERVAAQALPRRTASAPCLSGRLHRGNTGLVTFAKALNNPFHECQMSQCIAAALKRKWLEVSTCNRMVSSSYY